MFDFMAIAEDETKTNEKFDALDAIDKAAYRLKNQFGKTIRTYTEDVKKIQIHDKDSEEKAIMKAGEIKFLHIEIDNKRKEIIKDHDQFVRKVNSLVKSFKDILDPALSELKGKIGNYQYKKEIERREREKKALEEQKKLQNQIQKEAEKKGVLAPDMPDIVPVEKKQAVTRTESGASAHIRTEWTYELNDFAKLSDEYKMVDDKKIKAMIKAGIRNIDGLNIFEKPVTVLRG